MTPEERAESFLAMHMPARFFAHQGKAPYPCCELSRKLAVEFHAAIAEASRPNLEYRKRAQGVFAGMLTPWHGEKMPLLPDGKDPYWEDVLLIEQSLQAAVSEATLLLMRKPPGPCPAEGWNGPRG